PAFHVGVTENNLYWFDLRYPNGISGDKYSTVDYASKQGYPTLAIDRAGVGNSTHPDPIVELQVDLEEAISHTLVNQLRAARPYQADTRRTQDELKTNVHQNHLCRPLLRVGSRQRPDHYPLQKHRRIYLYPLRHLHHPCRRIASTQTVLVPAPTYTRRFSGLPIGYFATSSKIGRRYCLWGDLGSYNEAVFLRDFDNEDAVGLGELLSIAGGLKSAPQSTTPVFIVTGDNDGVAR
ncbi:MAG: hypothetical protein Q9214_003164, partial [Letrouitia sp. 1 TL-2023]